MFMMNDKAVSALAANEGLREELARSKPDEQPAGLGGDQIEVTYTQALALSLEPVSPAAAKK